MIWPAAGVTVDARQRNPLWWSATAEGQRKEENGIEVAQAGRKTGDKAWRSWGQYAKNGLFKPLFGCWLQFVDALRTPLVSPSEAMLSLFAKAQEALAAASAT